MARERSDVVPIIIGNFGGMFKPGRANEQDPRFRREKRALEPLQPAGVM